MEKPWDQPPFDESELAPWDEVERWLRETGQRVHVSARVRRRYAEVLRLQREGWERCSGRVGLCYEAGNMLRVALRPECQHRGPGPTPGSIFRDVWWYRSPRAGVTILDLVRLAERNFRFQSRHRAMVQHLRDVLAWHDDYLHATLGMAALAGELAGVP